MWYALKLCCWGYNEISIPFSRQTFVAENQPPEYDSVNQISPYEIPTAVAVEKDDGKKSVVRESLSFGGIVAWLTIIAVVVAMISLTAFSRSAEESRTEATSSDLFPIQLQGRALVGQKSFMGGTGTKAKEKENDEDDDKDDDSDNDNRKAKKKKRKSPATLVPDELNDGTYEQRLCYVLLINEDNGPEEAAEKLVELDEAAEEAGFEMSENQTRLRTIVQTLLDSQRQGDPDAESLSVEDRDFLRVKLGWIGELALAPQGTRNEETRKELLADASWSMGMMVVATLMGLLTLMAGFASAVAFAVLFATEKLRPKFTTCGKSLNIYVETFALWMVFFFGGPQLTAIAVQSSGIELSAAIDMTISASFFFGSLIVLIYPIMRGISFKQLCNDIGWKAKGGIIDILVSPINYIAGTPLMFCGMFCVLILTAIASFFVAEKPFGTSVAAGHPIQDIIANGQWLSIAYVILMACVAAPIVEETMFRGVLYRHLRELSGSWARWGSVIFSAVFNGVIFAAIHPQGFIAIPLLTALAINFSLAREWRDSLIAPIIMHAINNGAVTTFMVLMMS